MKATKPRGKVKKPKRARSKQKQKTKRTKLEDRAKHTKRAKRTKETTTKRLAVGKAAHKAQRLKYVLHKVGASAALAGKAARLGARAGAGAMNKAARLKAFVDKNSAYNESDENNSQDNLEKTRRAKERARKFRRWRKNRKRRRGTHQLTVREKAQKRVRKRLSARQKLRQRLAQRVKRALKQMRKRLEALIRRALAHALLHLAPLAAGAALMLLLVVGLPCCICMVAFPAMQSAAKASLANSQREIVVNAALDLQGLPYVWGGESITDGMDCSGLTQYAYGKINVSLPHSAQGQYDLVKSLGNLVTDVDQLQRGDLVFFGTPDNIYHVAIYLGNHKVVHEPGDYCKISDIDIAHFAGGGCPVAGGLQGGATGGVINVPQTDYNSYTITEYDRINWAQGSRQRELYDMWNSQGHWTNGIATIDGCYLIACTPTFGQVGDYVTFYLSDGTAIPCIIADEKNTSDEGCNSYGHDNGHSVIEFEVKSSYYHSYGNPGHGSWFPEWGGDRLVASCVNSGKNILG